MVMILAIHIAVALSSLAFSTYLLFSPSRSKMKVSYGLIAATLASGTILVLTDLTHLMSACMSGLVYLAGVMTLNLVAQNKLAAQESNK